MEDYRRKFQDLLRELFQFESADLDFGIYRIMNCKREAIEKFIENDLLDAVSAELKTGELERQENAVRKLESVIGKIRESFGGSAINGDGNLERAFHNTPLGQRYLELKELTRGAKSYQVLETTVFNHLYSFFSRYYDSGDFMSKRRYSKREKYAVPYNGEEVYLHWAHKDQYYIKTGEHFQDYSFKSRGLTVHFKLRNADIEQDNIKGDKRFFLPLVKEAEYKAETSEVIIPFAYRPLTEQESITYGSRNQQDSVIAEALGKIQEHFRGQTEALAALTAEKRKTANGETLSYLEHHLRRYTRRNTSDFFIHKNLQGFLERELDFYLKNEVLNLDELEAVGEIRTEGWFQTMRAIKNIGRKIIAFLAQIENFQKKLFEKKKFVTETGYCLTLDRVPEELYPEIAANGPQREEWVKLFAIDEINDTERGKYTQPLTVEFLKNNPFLVLDTKHFDQDFKDRLLASIDNMDENMDGLLIHSENFQALNLLQEGYREKVKCVYIDPPYNTFATKILYKNEYKHSSWLALMFDRISFAINVLNKNSILCVTIDDYEFDSLLSILKLLIGAENHLATVCIRNNPSGRSTVSGFSVNHEYALFFSKSIGGCTVGRLPHTKEQSERYNEIAQDGSRFEWENFRKSSSGSFRWDRPKQYFPFYYNRQTKLLRIPMMAWDDKSKTWSIVEDALSDEFEIWPIDSSRTERVWRYGITRATSILNKMDVRESQLGYEIYSPKYFQQLGVLPRTWWEKPEYSARDNGTRIIRDIFGSLKPFEFPKAPIAVMDCIRVCNNEDDSLVLDYFAGSGTTAHAVINLNREDGGSRKYILVEMGDYFDTVLVPRIKKVVYSADWKEGKPVSRRGSSHMFKYLRLESYEDALNNISFDERSGEPMLEFEDYLLYYILDWETKGSETYLDVKRLEKPFSYKLNLKEGDETQIKPVDLPETFNYLIGLEVDTRKVYNDGERKYLVYRGKVDHKSVMVIWREIEGWEEDDFKNDKKFIAEQKIADGADKIYVNGDSFVPGAQSLDPVFKRKMFEGIS